MADVLFWLGSTVFFVGVFFAGVVFARMWQQHHQPWELPRVPPADYPDWRWPS